ncbi:TetR/AcrR family transcriptional regulator [Pseudogulbenkiania sp. MAI-1]|uniref:TetR/AcrR family transcriptional regulator n=1 Tax=Pseudogulbenkiania sp. MAI-1 TaxID=990370 RepID=UPI00045EB641|nr:TetR/AcrR family transcriptional regulator [Pseudogulbenkiania sp. MAI-1]
MGRTSTIEPDRILNATERVIMRDSVARLTIDAVAAEAGVSKGGVLYTFRTKEALIQALMERMVRRYDEEIERCWPAEGIKPELAHLKAYIDAVLGLTGQDHRTAAAMLAAAMNNPTLLAPMQDFYARHLPRIRAALPDDRALTAFLAIEGMVFLELFGLVGFSQAEREHVVRSLHALIDGAAAS